MRLVAVVLDSTSAPLTTSHSGADEYTVSHSTWRCSGVCRGLPCPIDHRPGSSEVHPVESLNAGETSLIRLPSLITCFPLEPFTRFSNCLVPTVSGPECLLATLEAQSVHQADMLLAYASLVVRILLVAQPGDSTAWAVLALWAVRIVSLSLLLRAYVGPAILRLVSKRLRVRSVSLRSIRGIYFRAGGGTWRIDRVGISYHRPSSTTASRFSIVVEGVKLELTQREDELLVKPSLSRKRPGLLPSALSPLARRIWSTAGSMLHSVYIFLDPYVRPLIRTFFVGALRLMIRALPTLTHVLDFELNSAVVTLSAVPGIELAVKQAQVQTKVSLDSVVIPESSTKSRPNYGHKRFASVADWNARFSNSVRRTWDRAWSATQVTTSVSLRIKNITGTASPLSLAELPTVASAGEFCHDRHTFDESS